MRSTLLLLRRLCTEPAKKYASLWELCADLPNKGVGARLYRQSWVDKDYDPEEHHILLKTVNLVSVQLATRVRLAGRDTRLGICSHGHVPALSLSPLCLSSVQEKGCWTKDVKGKTDDEEWNLKRPCDAKRLEVPRCSVSVRHEPMTVSCCYFQCTFYVRTPEGRLVSEDPNRTPSEREGRSAIA